MGTTTKMAIPYPEATGLVKDGWEDMKDIANQVDAKSGLVLLKTYSPSAVSSLSLDAGTFTTNFKDYKIVWNAVLTNATQIVMRLRASGSDDSNSNYSNAVYRYQSDNTTGGEDARESSSLWAFNNANAGFQNDWEMNIYAPQATALTRFNGTGLLQISSSRIKAVWGAGHYNGTTSFDSLSLFVTAGTLTGTVKVYGINQ